MSVIQTARDNLRTSNRRILVMGAKGSGKTTFSVSASHKTGEAIAGSQRDCSDVFVVQGDVEGIMGAMGAGLVPGHVLDMTSVNTWEDYTKLLAQGLREMAPKFSDGTIKVIVVDLAWPAKLIDRQIDPSVQKDWKLVANEGGRLFRAFAGLPGITVIGNAQIKAASSPGETQQAIDAGAAKAAGGERSSFTIDLPKGIASLWRDNASFIFTREVRRVKDGRGNMSREFRTLTQSTARFEAASRAASQLQPTEPGDISLHTLLKRAYGDAL